MHLFDIWQSHSPRILYQSGAPAVRYLQILVFSLVAVWQMTGRSVANPPLPAAQVADRIDGIFRKTWEAQQVQPADLAGDAEFLRRVYLDLAGRIPAVSEVRSFLRNTDAAKRSQVVEQLLDSPAYVRNFTTVWRNALIPQATSQPQFRGVIPGFEAWLWKHVAEGNPYDRIVREIITTEVTSERIAGQALSNTTSPDAFFAVRELKPENLATGTSRAFLGVRLDCAQCHDHPFDKWSQQQFWNMAAFYSGFTQPGADGDNPAMMSAFSENRNARSIRIPDSDEVVPAVFLTGASPRWDDTSRGSREVLADWVTDPKNPWFSRMAVNRMWAQFFGQGLVHPIDDFSESNPPSQPAVLDLLADQFEAHDFDLKFLVRTITATSVYQLSSVQTHASQSDPTQFARSTLRGMTPEQFFDSLAEAVGFYQPYRTENPFVLDADSPRSQFLELFRNDSESPLDHETTILQALAMMNGEFVANATSLNDSQTLKAITDFPLMSQSDRLETLFLATVNRMPTADERQRLVKYLEEASASRSEASALSDIFWALLNSSEFLLNH
jgi:hypothetical protein